MRDLAVFGLALVASSVGTCLADEATPPAVDRIVIEKSTHRLALLHDGKTVKTYSVALGSHPFGPKQRAGDGRTPEGTYSIDARKADSSFHRALHISYPNAEDRARASAAGIDPGGDIMIHGLRNGLGWLGSTHRLLDWTKGCIAMTDSEIDELWAEVPVGTPVEIRP